MQCRIWDNVYSLPCYACEVQKPLDTTDQETADICRKRLLRCPKSLSKWLQVEGVMEVVEPDELDQLEEEETEHKKKKATIDEYVKDYHAHRKALQGPAVPALNSPSHPLYGKTFTRKIPEHSVEQKEAKKMMPPGPGSSIWRGNPDGVKRSGSWNIHVLPFPRDYFSWAKCGSERAALREAIKMAWTYWLLNHNLPQSHCPIEGLFP